MTNNVPDERLRAAATQFRDTWMRAGAVRVNDSRSSEITMLVDFARLREDSAMREAAGLVTEICNRKEEGAIYNQDFSEACHDKALGEYIVKKIHEWLALKGGTE